MSSITLSPGAFILLALVCGFFSALAAGAVMQKLVARHVREAIYTAVEDSHCILVREVSCNVTVTADDGNLVVRRQMATTGQKVTAKFVEQWLESRDLVMAPKGRDYGVKVKAS